MPSSAHPAAPSARPARILALDSATQQCSVALLWEGAIRQRIAAADARNSETMLPLARALLDEAGIGVAALDAIAFGAGPGAFTGLRVACGVAQGLALGADLPLIPVGTLEALAETACPSDQADGPQRVLAALDARMGECYWAELERADADWRIRRGPLLCRPEAAPLPEGDGWCAVGDAFTTFADLLGARLAGHLSASVGRPALPQAQGVLRLALLRWQRGGTIAPEDAHPVYVRDKVAQTTAERRRP